MKKIFCLLISLSFILILVSCKSDSLPLPETEDGMRGQLGIDRNINESTIDQYLNRDDSVYRDMRMLKDEADYEAIGGDSYLSGYIKGFEIVPYPYLCNVKGLPEEVGNTYSGSTLFTVDEDGNYTANYQESEHILESLFPKDKYIFLMCGGGGYAGMTKNLLIALGWDENKIYNTGGYWYYDGQNKIETTYEEDGELHYDFSLVPYHMIDFDTLTSLNQSQEKDEESSSKQNYIQITSTAQLQELEDNKETFALYVYLPGCVSCASFDPIVSEFVSSNQIKMYAAELTDLFKESNSVSDRISYTPSMFIYIDGEVAAYLDPGSNDDLKYYQSLENLTSWFSQYLDIEILKSDLFNQMDECESACSITD